MSGGSYNYLYTKDSSEKTGLIVQQREELLADFDRFVGVNLTYNEAYETDKKQPYERPATEIEQIAVALTRKRFVEFIEKAKVLIAEADQFDDLLHSIEWTASCDTGPSAVVHSCIKYFEERVGVKLVELKAGR